MNKSFCVIVVIDVTSAGDSHVDSGIWSSWRGAAVGLGGVKIGTLSGGFDGSVDSMCTKMTLEEGTLSCC